MKLFILILSLSLPTFAITEGRFLGTHAMIQIRAMDSNGGSSPDADDLYYSLNVSNEDSMYGPGKKLETPDKSFSLVCVRQPQKSQCHILIKASPNLVMNPARRLIHYTVTGQMARIIQNQFHLNEKNQFRMTTTDGYLRIDVRDGHFELIFDGQGLSAGNQSGLPISLSNEAHI
jgi:hypothetical protein